MTAQRDTIPIGPLGPWLPQRTVLATIMPEQAKVILEAYNGENRRFRPMVSSAISKALKTGSWRVNGETIIFGFDDARKTGVLLDGQNRLQGCILAGMAMPTWVGFGFDPAVFTTIDRGSSRNLADDLSVRHEKNAALSAAVIRLAWGYFNGIRSLSLPACGITPEEAFDFLEQHPEIRDAVSFARLQKKSCPIAGRVVGASHFLFGLKEPSMRDDFFEKLFSGAEMEQGHPVLAARNKLWQERMVITNSLKGNSGNYCFASLYYLISAWNHLRRGNSVSKLQMFRTGSFKDEKTVVLPEII